MNWGQHWRPNMSRNKANKREKHRALSVCSVIAEEDGTHRWFSSRWLQKHRFRSTALNTDSISKRSLHEHLHKWRRLESWMQQVVNNFPFWYCTLWVFASWKTADSASVNMLFGGGGVVKVESKSVLDNVNRSFMSIGHPEYLLG